jgi:hypothetical protein
MPHHAAKTKCHYLIRYSMLLAIQCYDYTLLPALQHNKKIRVA